MNGKPTTMTRRERAARNGRSPRRGSRAATPSLLPAIRVGVVAGFDAAGAPLVEFEHEARDRVVAARTTVELAATHVGRDVALVFENGDAARPIVIGLLRGLTSRGADQVEHLVLTAGREIVLRSGKASITLHHDGRVVVQGEHLVSRSNGVNRIKGGSVQIN